MDGRDMILIMVRRVPFHRNVAYIHRLHRLHGGNLGYAYYLLDRVGVVFVRIGVRMDHDHTIHDVDMGEHGDAGLEHEKQRQEHQRHGYASIFAQYQDNK